MWYLVSSSSRFGGHDRLDDVLQNVGAQLLVGDGLGVLGRDDHRVDANGLVVLVVLDRDLALAVGAEVGQLAVLAHFGELLVSLCASEIGVGISSGVLVGGIAEHHALVAGAAGVHAHGDVAGLLVDGGDHGAGVGVEAVERVVVADGGDHAAHQRLEVDVGLGGDFAGDDDEAGGGQGLARDAAVGVLLQAGVQDRVGDLVGDLVGMPFRHRFGRKQKSIVLWQRTSSVSNLLR